ncbi:MAG TPA: BlaI/MecI/CopY family transcriptional regulator [Planctomycetaceae bacterium]|nr:BlaI/MecI/CopY family transcriptional regulator [Planctomycetaceae bacterium]
MAEPSLPDAELEVLACLWNHGPLTAREIRETMAGYRSMTHSAVSTLLARLHEKSLVNRSRGTVGKAFVYEAAVPARRTYRRIARQMLERVFGGDPLTLVSSLFHGRPPTSDELDRLQDLLDRLRSEQKKGHGK